ncbi:MAG: DNA-protecting protein DprA [Alphaproteobacteria bacterium]|nr:DNA-protecting protein DprA [Alphaproteobacteria bacterium]QQS58233.1 MAG: DNA-protecting protein DprA [Alphaproteobacteria bacterium]
MKRNTLLKTETPTDSEKIDWLRLSRTEHIGPVTFYQLMARFGSAAQALDALPELSKRGGRARPLIAASRAEAEREYAALQKIGGDVITVSCEAYPLALSALDDAPPVLSILGNPALLNRSCIGVVGARNASLNGRKFAEKISRELGQRGQVIASGLARGIDTAAHQGSLETGTIAVVAGGIDVVYPEENQKLYEQIAQRGALLAESKFGQKPFAQSFPRRNRIVSGLSKGVVIVEATMKSGSLITARLAGEQGRDVYAVPGSPLDPRAAGPNHLIREGATLVRGADDVMEALLNFSGNALREPLFASTGYDVAPLSGENPADSEREAVLSCLSHAPINIDELIRACHLTVSAVQTILLELELAGRVRRLPGHRVSLISGDAEG